MELVDIDDLPARQGDDDVAHRSLTDAFAPSNLAINHYRVPAVAGLPGGLHAHLDQEEIFVVLAGELTFETLTGEVAVAAGEAIRFAPGEYQSGRNAGTAPAVVLALGAPRDSDEIRVPLSCPDCDHEPLRPTVREDRPVLVCPDCGASHDGRCPACESPRMAVTIDPDSDGPVAACRDCGRATTPGA